MSLKTQFLSSFPPPIFLSMPAAGIDISDYSIKFIEFTRNKHGMRVERFGSKKIPPGIVVSGRIQKHDELVAILTELRKENKLRFVRASLPEERGYLFDTEVPNVKPTEVRNALGFSIEEHVPIPPEQAVFDYDAVRGGTTDKHNKTVVVSVFPREEVETYASLFTRAGLIPLSLEIEAQALARAVIPHNDLRTHLIVDFGKERSGISIASGGVTRLAATVTGGGDAISEAIRSALPDATEEKIAELKNTQGVNGFPKYPEVQKTVEHAIDELVAAIDKYNVFWSTHAAPHEKREGIASIILCGGNANLAGLPEYVSRTLGIPAERANVWTNVLSVNEDVPPIHFKYSLGYAPAIGLALHTS